jgi:hypothetical protein
MHTALGEAKDQLTFSARMYFLVNFLTPPPLPSEIL